MVIIYNSGQYNDTYNNNTSGNKISNNHIDYINNTNNSNPLYLNFLCKYHEERFKLIKETSLLSVLA